MATRKSRNPLGISSMNLKTKKEALAEVRAMDKEIEEELNQRAKGLNHKDDFE